VVREFHDDGISGTAMGNRPGVLALMAAARRGEIDAVIAEHTDRLSRAGSDGWAIYEDLAALGVRYLTVHEGQVTEVDQGVSSLISAMKIREVKVRTRGGLNQVVSYGDAVRREYDAKGEPIRGLREIVPAEASIVVRIFEAYATAIAHSASPPA
jgi:DNA invertase Pin-like site-specific DNA recombinase